MNLPNSITMSRIASVPLLIWFLSPHSPFQGANGEQEMAASALFIVASITDGLDGYLARKRGQITTIGMLLDPLADKLMIAAAYIILVAYNPRIVPVWIAVLIIGREFLVSGLRAIAASEGFTIDASEIGKLKTVIQIVSVVAAILAHHWDYWLWFGGRYVVGVHFIAMTAIYWMTCVSVISAVTISWVLEEDRPCQRVGEDQPEDERLDQECQGSGDAVDTSFEQAMNPERRSAAGAAHIDKSKLQARAKPRCEEGSRR